jgi:hypothetical protein
MMAAQRVKRKKLYDVIHAPLGLSVRLHTNRFLSTPYDYLKAAQIL